MDAELYSGLEELVGQDHTDTQRLLASLSAKDGGLAFGGLPRRSAPAFLGSWALNLQHVADLLGVATVEGFQARCPTIAAAMARAEAALLAAGGNGGRPLDWLQYLQEGKPKQQGLWSKELSRTCHRELKTSLSEPDAADFLSHGGPGAREEMGLVRHS